MGLKLKKSMIKWSVLVFLGCIAYLAGNYWGQRQLVVEHAIQRRVITAK